jgi:hypothetical protein
MKMGLSLYRLGSSNVNVNAQNDLEAVNAGDSSAVKRMKLSGRG